MINEIFYDNLSQGKECVIWIIHSMSRHLNQGFSTVSFAKIYGMSANIK